LSKAVLGPGKDSDCQAVVCQGCGSVWIVNVAKGHAVIVAKLQECPLCELKQEDKL
jgi:hypothetical protein